MATEATEHGAAAVSSCVDSHGSAVGMPALCGDWYANQIFWLVVTLVVIYFVLSKVALPRIAAVLSERQGTITNDIELAVVRQPVPSESAATFVDLALRFRRDRVEGPVAILKPLRTV